MRLYLMRHAAAVPRGTPGYAQDMQRPLTEEGHEQARSVAKGLKRLHADVDLIVTSPYLRALQTAEQVAHVFGPRMTVKELDELRADVSPRETSIALKALAAHEQIVLVGHEPHLSTWVGELVADHGGMRCFMKKAGVACIEIDRVPPPQGSGTLRWLMTPKQLTLIGEAVR